MVAIGEKPNTFVLAVGVKGGSCIQLGYGSKDDLVEAMVHLAELVQLSGSLEDAITFMKNMAEKQGFKPAI